MTLPVPIAPPPNVIGPSAAPPVNVVPPPNVVAAPKADTTGAARPPMPKRPAEVPPEFYTMGHLAFFALPKEAREGASGTTKARISRGVLPDGKGLIALDIDPKAWKTSSEGTPVARRVAEGPPRSGGYGPGGGASLLSESEAGKAIKAAWPTATFKEIAEVLDASVEEVRLFLSRASTPSVHGARALEAKHSSLTLGMWHVTEEGKAAYRAKRDAAEEKRKAKAEASAPKA